MCLFLSVEVFKPQANIHHACVRARDSERERTGTRAYSQLRSQHSSACALTCDCMKTCEKGPQQHVLRQNLAASKELTCIQRQVALAHEHLGLFGVDPRRKVEGSNVKRRLGELSWHVWRRDSVQVHHAEVVFVQILVGHPLADCA